MAKAFKVKFIRNCNNKVPEGYEIQVVTTSSKPQDLDIRKALEAAGIKIGGDTISGSYKILD
jgi:hypothetical protein